MPSFDIQNQSMPDTKFIPQEYPVMWSNKFFRLIYSIQWNQEY